MSDPDKTIPQSPDPGSSPTGGPGLRRITVLASAAGATIVAVLLGAIVAFQSSDNVLSPEDVAQRLASDGSSSAPSADDNPSGDDLSPSPSTSGMPLPGGGLSGTPSVLDTVAATITLTCDGSSITHATWSVKPGYRLDERSQTSARLRLFIESDVHDDVTLIATCPAKVSASAEPDDHGGGGDDHGGGKGKG